MNEPARISLYRAILMLICMILSEMFFFISNFNPTFLAFMIVSAIIAFFDLCEYSEELNKEADECLKRLFAEP